MPSPKKFRETKKKRRRKVVLHAKRGKHQKECNTKTTLENRKKPGKTARKLTRYLKGSHVFSYVVGPKFPKSQGAESFTNLKKKKHPRIQGYTSFVAFNVSRILGGFWCPTGWTLVVKRSIQISDSDALLPMFGGDFEQPLNFLAFRFVSKSRLFYNPALPERKQLKLQEA